MIMKIAIIGSRSFKDYSKLEKSILTHIAVSEIDLIVSGGAVGADSLAESFADKYKIPVKLFLPDWELYGRSAGVVRNKYIIKESDVVIAFWDGISKGTKHSIDLANKQNKKVIIIS